MSTLTLSLVALTLTLWLVFLFNANRRFGQQGLAVRVADDQVAGRKGGRTVLGTYLAGAISWKAKRLRTWGLGLEGCVRG